MYEVVEPTWQKRRLTALISPKFLKIKIHTNFNITFSAVRAFKVFGSECIATEECLTGFTTKIVHDKFDYRKIKSLPDYIKIEATGAISANSA